MIIRGVPYDVLKFAAHYVLPVLLFAVILLQLAADAGYIPVELQAWVLPVVATVTPVLVKLVAVSKSNFAAEKLAQAQLTANDVVGLFQQYMTQPAQPTPTWQDAAEDVVTAFSKPGEWK